MKNATTRILFSYWDTLRGERAAPERGEFEPGAIRHVLGDTFILEVDASRTALFRLAGTRLCALTGGELKGRDLASLWPRETKADLDRLIDTVMGDAAGVVGGITGTTEGREQIDLELLLLPLRHRGRTHSRILGALSPVAVPTWIGIDPVVSLSILSLRIIWPSGKRPAFGDAGRDSIDRETLERRRHLIVHQGGRT